MNNKIKKYILLVDKSAIPVDYCIYKRISIFKEFGRDNIRYEGVESNGGDYCSPWIYQVKNIVDGTMKQLFEVYQSNNLKKIKELAMLEIL